MGADNEPDTHPRASSDATTLRSKRHTTSPSRILQNPTQKHTLLKTSTDTRTLQDQNGRIPTGASLRTTQTHTSLRSQPGSRRLSTTERTNPQNHTTLKRSADPLEPTGRASTPQHGHTHSSEPSGHTTARLSKATHTPQKPTHTHLRNDTRTHTHTLTALSTQHGRNHPSDPTLGQTRPSGPTG